MECGVLNRNRDSEAHSQIVWQTSAKQQRMLLFESGGQRVEACLGGAGGQEGRRAGGQEGRKVEDGSSEQRQGWARDVTSTKESNK
jgi:hypothetical protein